MSKVIDIKEKLYERATQKSNAIHRDIDNATERIHLVRAWSLTSLQFPCDTGIDFYFRNALHTRIHLKAKELGIADE